jgi:hypothetical protein
MSGKESSIGIVPPEELTIPANDMEIVNPDHSRRKLGEWLRDHRGVVAIGTSFFAGSLLLSACAGGNQSKPQPSVSSGNAQNSGSEVVGCTALKPFDVSVAPPSIFGQMYVQKNNGTQANFPPQKASDQIRSEACFNRGPLAVLDAIYELYQNVQTPTDLAQQIKINYDSFTPGSQAAQTAEKNVVNFATLLNETSAQDPFVVSTGASVIQATANGIEITNATLGNGTVEGYTVAANNQSLNAIEQARIADLGKMIVITNGGRVLVNETLADVTINESKNNKPNQRSGGGGGQSPRSSAQSQNSNNETGLQAHGTGSSSNEGQSPNPTGTTGNRSTSGGGGITSTGTGTGNTGSGTGIGGTGSGSGGEGGGGTTNTFPPTKKAPSTTTTLPPPSTTTTLPPPPTTTTLPPPPTTTTLPPTKSGVGCNPNITYCP